MTPRQAILVVLTTCAVTTLVYREWFPVLAAAITTAILGAVFVYLARRGTGPRSNPPTGRTSS